MKRCLISLLLVLCLTISGLSFAAAEEKPSGTLEFWSFLTQEVRAKELDNIARAYEQANPDVKVNITVMPWSGALDNLVAAVLAGNAPDLFITGTGYPQTLAGTGGLLELSDVVEEIGGADTFLSTSLTVQGASEDGGLYSIPIYITPYVAYYRHSWLKDAGVEKLPTTWEEYYDMCKAVTDPANNRYGFALPLGDLHGWKTIWSFLQGNGVNLINKTEDGEWFLDLNEESRAAAEETYDYLYKLVKDCAPEGTINYTQSEVRELVASGTVMSRIDTPEIFFTVNSIAPENLADFGYFQIPGRKQTGSGQGWVGLSVYNKGNTAAAKDFIKFMFSGDTLVDFYASYAYAMFPAQEALYHSDKYINSMPAELKELVPDMALDILSTSSSLVMANGPFPNAGEVESQKILGNALIKMLSEGYTSAQAVDYIVSEIENLME